MKKYLLVLFFLGHLTVVSQVKCELLPKSFTSYSTAIDQVCQAKFSYTDNVNTSNSSWVSSANFYSCDGKKGYLIIGTKEQIYIHQNLPVNLWHGFKSASSYGSYYTHNIRNRYQLHLSK